MDGSQMSPEDRKRSDEIVYGVLYSMRDEDEDFDYSPEEYLLARRIADDRDKLNRMEADLDKAQRALADSLEERRKLMATLAKVGFEGEVWRRFPWLEVKMKVAQEVVHLAKPHPMTLIDHMLIEMRDKFAEAINLRLPAPDTPENPVGEKP